MSDTYGLLDPTEPSRSDAIDSGERGFAAWLTGDDYAGRYRARAFAACAACPARGQATDAQMERQLALRQQAAPERVRLLLIAESPPRSAPEAMVRHFYHPESP